MSSFISDHLTGIAAGSAALLVDLVLLRGSYGEAAIAGVMNGVWQQWYQQHAPSSRAPYLTLTNVLLPVVVPAAVGILALNLSTRDSALLALSGAVAVAGFNTASLGQDLVALKDDVEPAAPSS
jgi:hypothetical protein